MIFKVVLPPLGNITYAITLGVYFQQKSGLFKKIASLKSPLSVYSHLLYYIALIISKLYACFI